MYYNCLKVPSTLVCNKCPCYLTCFNKKQQNIVPLLGRFFQTNSATLFPEVDNVDNEGKKSVRKAEKSGAERIDKEKMAFKNFDGKRYQIYNTVLYEKEKNRYFESRPAAKIHQIENSLESNSDISVAAFELMKSKLVRKRLENTEECKLDGEAKIGENAQQYPFSIYTSIGENEPHDDQVGYEESETLENGPMSSKKVYIDSTEERKKFFQPETEDVDPKEEFDMLVFQKMRYGTPNPNVPPSKVPCNGCGAVFHCQDSGIPGYMPSEIFRSLSTAELRNILCQRCHFIRKHKIALDVNVSPDDYVRLLSDIRKKLALIILVVDMTDIPCSIWPNLVDVVGRNCPMFVVGNKVDLLPRDKPGYLERMKLSLCNTLKTIGLDTGNNIKHVCLTSAKTGFGMEQLISKIQNSWGVKGDVYLVGCTNVGKSSMFNALLQSDFCKSEAVDIINKATVSEWPGTTLNLLKFPILRPSGWRMYLRTTRLIRERISLQQENYLRKEMLAATKNPKYGTPIGHIGLTFYQHTSAFPRGLHNAFEMPVNTMPNVVTDVSKTFRPRDQEFRFGKWCYDTPGSVNSEQVLGLLTLDELQTMLSKKIITPRTYAIKPGYSFFLAGIARLDYIQGQQTIRYTVFSSSALPITVVPTVIADGFYQHYFGSEVFQIPKGNDERLKDFPPLLEKDFKITGIGYAESCADIILSSAGWVAITARNGNEVVLKAFTPNGKGCYCRQPALLPFAVNLKGKRIKFTPCYKNDK